MRLTQMIHRALEKAKETVSTMTDESHSNVSLILLPWRHGLKWPMTARPCKLDAKSQ